MKTSILSVGKAGSWFTGFAFVAAIIGAGSAGAETYRQGGSTATIHQSGGSGKSESHVTRYPDGQRIITQDGSNTDITIQREGRFLPPDSGGEYPEKSVDCFERRLIEKRFSRMDLDDADCFEGRSSCARVDFKRRMLDRMRSGFLP